MLIHRYWAGTSTPHEHYPHPNGTLWRDFDIPAEIEAFISSCDRILPDDIPRHRANILRWFLLYHHGGLWLDCDAEIAGELPPPPWIWGSGTPATHDNALCLAAISLPRHHPFASTALRAIGNYRGAHGPAPSVSGRHVIERVLHDVPVIHGDFITHERATTKEKQKWLSHRAVSVSAPQRKSRSQS